MLVNILNEGKIPLMDTPGPIFGYDISDAAYHMYIRYFPNVKIERTTYQNAIAKKKEYLASKDQKKTIILHDSVAPVVEDSVVINEIKTNTEDDEIDKILGEEPVKEESTIDIVKEAAEVRSSIVYKDSDLAGLTRKELSKILIDRGYTPATKKFEKSSPFAPKYHDTVKSLIEKIKKTQ